VQGRDDAARSYRDHTERKLAPADTFVPKSEELTSMTSIRVKSQSPAHKFNGVKIFSATMFSQRQQLGDGVTQWLSKRPELAVVDIVVTQSSDAAFHCVTISVFYREPIEPTASARGELGGGR
jgi:hypothetical protein